MKKAENFISSINNKLKAGATQEEYETLTKQIYDFTANIRPFYDAMALSGNERDESQYLKDFRVNCQRTFNGFLEALNTIRRKCVCMEYTHSDKFPFLEKRK